MDCIPAGGLLISLAPDRLAGICSKSKLAHPYAPAAGMGMPPYHKIINLGRPRLAMSLLDNVMSCW